MNGCLSVLVLKGSRHSPRFASGARKRFFFRAFRGVQEASSFSQLKSFEHHNNSRFARTSSRPSRRRAPGASTATTTVSPRPSPNTRVHAHPSPFLFFLTKTPKGLVADRAERLERALAVLGRLHGDAEHADHREAAMLELGGLQLEEGLVGGGVRELEGVEVAAGVGALLRVELCEIEGRGRKVRVELFFS
jgi:hypothetical protein